MVDEDKLFDEDGLEEPALLDDEEDDLGLLDEDEDDLEEEDDLDPKHLGSLGFGIEEEEF
jgi:hypothetical protein